MAKAWDKMSDATPDLIRRCRDDLMGYFINRNVDRSKADDLTQATLMATVCQIHRWRKEAGFKHYVMAVARNLLSESRRFDVRRAARMVSLEEESESVSKTESLQPLADAVVIDQDALSRVEMQLELIPEPYREVVALRLRGYTNSEIVEATGLRYHTVRSRLSRGLQRIREGLAL